MQLDALIRALAPGAVIGRRDVEISDLAYDTRRVAPGSRSLLLRARDASRRSRPRPRAVTAGAAALVAERPLELAVPQLVVPDSRRAMPVAADLFFGEPPQLDVASVTGTNGKTTTTFLLHSILDRAGRRPGLVGTVQWRVGGEVRPAPFTTPEAIDLQRLFRELLDAGDRSVAVEASSSQGGASPARPCSLRRLVSRTSATTTSISTERWRTTSRRNGASSRVRRRRLPP